MDLNLTGKNALVCAASRGLGRACAEALAREGCDVTITGRDRAALEATAEAIASTTGRRVLFAEGDISTAAGRSAALAVCPGPDILINNAGGPPGADFRKLTEAQWLQALQSNMLAAIAMIGLCVEGMTSRGFGRVVNITSMAEVRPSPENPLSSASRAGLASFVRAIAPQVARHNVTVNNLLPGPFDTARLASFPERLQFFRNGPAGRVGTPFEFGEACAFLCGAHAGFITGQSLLMDGGFSIAGSATPQQQT
ncbi:SDR family oxidoreductase [Ramlibacter sp.]|uniref:SDR family oxidoreductase n=1 Tax=Ramlibacter sp. TaxID=1917967 RepID=UPI003D120CB6